MYYMCRREWSVDAPLFMLDGDILMLCDKSNESDDFAPSAMAKYKAVNKWALLVVQVNRR